jgi:hypothetical protein
VIAASTTANVEITIDTSKASDVRPATHSHVADTRRTTSIPITAIRSGAERCTTREYTGRGDGESRPLTPQACRISCCRRRVYLPASG